MSDRAFTKFGADDDSWNVGGPTDDGDGSGNPGIALFGRALQVWAVCQGVPVSVADAAKAFRVPPLIIVEAVANHAWMYLSGPSDNFSKLMIEHEGE